MILLARLLLYILLVALPAFHPAVVEYIDMSFLIRSFVLIPLAMWLAWKAPERGALRLRYHLIATTASFVLLPFLGFTWPLLEVLALVNFVYWSSYALYYRKWVGIFYIDMSYFLYVLYRVLSLHTSEAQVFNGVAVFFMLAGFLTYSVLNFRLQQSARNPRRAEVFLMTALPLAIAVLFIFVVPNSFTSDIRFLSNLQNIIDPPLQPLSESDGGEEGQGSENGDAQAELFSLAPNAWPNRSGEGDLETSNLRGNGQGPQNQYLVMIVNSPVPTLYLADEYYNHLDAEAGFYSDPEFDLNRLTHSQYLETWQNPQQIPPRNRSSVRVDVYSTLPEKVSSYLPHRIEPTVRDTQFYPLSYTYRAESRVSNISIYQQYPQTGELSESERGDLLPYLGSDLPQNVEQAYREAIDGIIPQGAGYMERIVAILQNFRSYQYELGFSDNVSVQAITNFFFQTRTGDCTEFSNSAAILARLAGIPSRVVTGYLVSAGLQTPAHRQAVEELKGQFPPIANVNSDSLYIVTSAHRHSWAQFYVPGYGWADFEATAFAIPPVGSLDANNLDLVIPDLSESFLRENNQSIFAAIPWALIAQLTGLAVLLAIAFLYVYRWSRIIRLALLSRRENETGYKALYRLLLIRLRARGFALKSSDRTPREYSQDYPEFATFAESYSDLIFGQSGSPTDLRSEYKRLLGEKKRGASLLIEIFSLRDFEYM